MASKWGWESPETDTITKQYYYGFKCFAIKYIAIFSYIFSPTNYVPKKKTLSTSVFSFKMKFPVCSSHFNLFYCSKMYPVDGESNWFHAAKSLICNSNNLYLKNYTCHLCIDIMLVYKISPLGCSDFFSPPLLPVRQKNWNCCEKTAKSGDIQCVKKQKPLHKENITNSGEAKGQHEPHLIVEELKAGECVIIHYKITTKAIITRWHSAHS